MAKRISGGSTRNKSDSAGKRLGFKRLPTQRVKKGEIILRQRGTTWYPGNNVTMGRDHTLNANKSGMVESSIVRDRKSVRRMRRVISVVFVKNLNQLTFNERIR